MDFTYFVAGFLSFVVGAGASVIFVLLRGRSKTKLVVLAVLFAVVLDAALLIDWRHFGEAPPLLIVLDLLFFTIYGVIGTVAGAAPTLLLRAVWRRRASQGFSRSTAS